MKKSKIILQSNIFLLLLIISLIYSFIYIKIIDHKSIYDINQNTFTGIIKDYKINGNKLTIKIDSKEPLIAIYYINNINELEYLKNNLEYGQNIEIKGILTIPNNNTIPNTFNYKKYLYYHHIYYILNIKEIKLYKTNNKLLNIKNIINKRILKIDELGYLNAFILGNKNYIDENIYNNYQTCGITHLFALSGMHIGLISSIFLKIFKRKNKYIKYILLDILLILYGYIVNFPSSLLRCIIFFILNSINKIFNLNIKTINIFYLTIFIIILLDPFILFDTGFQYSITTIFGILYCKNYINNNPLKLSIVTFLFSLPISLSSFYQINILSIIYNLIYIPFVSIIIYPLSLLSSMFPFIYKIFILTINILEISTKLLSKIDISIIYLKFNMYEVIIFYLILIIAFKCNIKLIILNILLIISIHLYPYIDNSLYIYYLDVGQGDSTLIITPYKKEVILIDTGGKTTYKEDWYDKKETKVSDNYLQLLKSLSINKIDYLILTHGDYDHMGDSDNIIDKIKVNKVIFNCGEYNNLENNIISKTNNYIKCPNNIKLNNNELIFLNTKLFDNENDNSSVIYYKYNNYNFLFMGDASIEREKEILNKYNLTNIDFFKIGHHGSNTSSSKEFISIINPKYSIISVGKNNRYGHPKKSVLDILNNSNIYRTDIDGSIEVKINKSGYKIKTYNP